MHEKVKVSYLYILILPLNPTQKNTWFSYEI